MPFLKKNWFVFCLIPVGLLAFVLYKYLLNLPTGDDIFLLDIFNQLKEADSFWDKIVVLFSQHNEHRIVITRLIALLQYWISGTVDLRAWIILGNISLVLTIGLFYKHIGNQKWWLVPIAFILLSPASNTLFAMQASNLLSVFFGLATIHFLLKKPSRPDTAYLFLFSGLSIFSNSGGIAILLIAAAVLFLQKRYRLLVLWTLWCAVVLIGYYWNYEKVYRHPSYELILQQIPQAVEFFLAFLGSIGFRGYAAVPAGFCFLILSLIATYRKYYLQNPFVFLCMVYILMIAGMCTLKRYEYGIDNAIADRFRIYSMVLAASSLLVIRDLLSAHLPLQKSAFWLCVLLSVAVNLEYVMIISRQTEKREEELYEKMENYHLNNSGFNCFEVNILNKLTANQIYSFPLEKRVHDKHFYDSLNTFQVGHIQLRVNRAYQTQQYLIIRGMILNPPSEINYLQLYLHKFIILHPADTPFNCLHSELIRPVNDKSLMLNIELDNNRNQLKFPEFLIKVPKKHFSRRQYALSFLFMTDTSVNHSPLVSNVRFHL